VRAGQRRRRQRLYTEARSNGATTPLIALRAAWIKRGAVHKPLCDGVRLVNGALVDPCAGRTAAERPASPAWQMPLRTCVISRSRPRSVRLLCCGPLSSPLESSSSNTKPSRVWLPSSRPPTPRSGPRRRPARHRGGRACTDAAIRHSVAPTFSRRRTRVRVCRGSMTQFSPSIRARTQARGPLRLCSLDPDTGAAVPSPFRSPRRPNAQRTRSTRETRRLERRAYATFTIAP